MKATHSNITVLIRRRFMDALLQRNYECVSRRYLYFSCHFQSATALVVDSIVGQRYVSTVVSKAFKRQPCSPIPSVPRSETKEDDS